MSFKLKSLDNLKLKISHLKLRRELGAGEAEGDIIIFVPSPLAPRPYKNACDFFLCICPSGVIK
jgi:hypothetical protein